MKKIVKLVVCGKYSIGKSALVRRIDGKGYNENSITTIAASFVAIDTSDTRVTIWDTAGQERFDSLLPMYFRDAHLVLYCWDITREFDAEHALKTIRRAKLASNSPMIFMAATKTDLTNQYNVEAQEFAKKNHIVEVFYTSAKKNIGIDRIIEKMLSSLKYQGTDYEPIEIIKLETDMTNEINNTSCFPNCTML